MQSYDSKALTETLLKEWMRLSEDNKEDIVVSYQTIKKHAEFQTELKKVVTEEGEVDCDKFPVDMFCGSWDEIVGYIQADVNLNEAFFKILNMITSAVSEQCKNKLNTFDLLGARKQVLYTLERLLGADFTPSVRDAWVHLSSFVLLCFVSKQHCVETEVPEKQDYDLCMKTLDILSQDGEYWENKLKLNIEEKAPEAYKVLYKNPIVVGELLSKIIGVSGYHKAFYNTLKKLGTMHQSMGVYPEFLEAIKMPFVEIAIEALGKQWNDDYLTAWVKVYGYIQYVMGNAICEQFLCKTYPKPLNIPMTTRRAKRVRDLDSMAMSPERKRMRLNEA